MLPNTSAPSLTRQQRPYLIAANRWGTIGAMSKDDKRRGTVTDEHREEARLLTILWKRTKSARQESGFGTQEAFGAEFGIGNQSAVGFFLNGKTALSMKAARGFARGLGCQIADFSPRLAAQLLPAAWPHPRAFSLLGGSVAEITSAPIDNTH